MAQFERFSDDIRAAMLIANREAKWHLHSHIDVPHLLIALAREPTGLAYALLHMYGTSAREIRTILYRNIPRGWSLCVVGKLPLTSALRSLVDHATERAVRSSHDAVGTGGMLLSMLETDPRVPSYLMSIGVDIAKLERHLALALHRLMVDAPTEAVDLQVIGEQMSRDGATTVA